MDVIGDRKLVLHRNVGDTKCSQIKRGRSWMTLAETTIKGVANIDNMSRRVERIQSTSNGNYHQVIIALGREYRVV